VATPLSGEGRKKRGVGTLRAAVGGGGSCGSYSSCVRPSDDALGVLRESEWEEGILKDLGSGELAEALILAR